MLHECREAHVLWAIFDVEFYGGILFFYPMECRGPVKINQISKFKFFLLKHAYIVHFCSRIPKRALIQMRCHVKFWRNCKKVIRYSNSSCPIAVEKCREQNSEAK